MVKPIKDRSIDQPVWVGFGIAFFVMVMVAGISLSNVVQSSSSAELLDHTHKVMSKFYDLRIQAARAENKQWNYMLTKNRDALTERDNSMRQVKESFPSLLDLTKENPAQQARIARLQSAFESRFTVLIDGQLKFDADGYKIDRVFFDAGK